METLGKLLLEIAKSLKPEQWSRRLAALRATFGEPGPVWYLALLATAAWITVTTLFAPDWATRRNHLCLIPTVTMTLCLLRGVNWITGMTAVVLLHATGIVMYHFAGREASPRAIAMMVSLISLNLAYCATLLALRKYFRRYATPPQSPPSVLD